MTVRLIETINSKNGNEIQLIEAESHLSINKGKTILFIGVFHGDEPEGESLINKLISKIKINPNLIKNNRILFIPALNPDGKILNKRTNANEVDLNRNFPTNNWILSKKKDAFYSGDTRASEIETQFVIKIIENFIPDLIITIHKPFRIVNFDGPALEVAKTISECTGYPLQSDIGYPTPGSFGTYAGIERNIPTVTLELPDNTSIKELWQQNRTGFYNIISS